MTKSTKNTGTPDKSRYLKLAASLILDGIGMLTYLFLGFGETADMVWAPISGLACFAMYRGRLGFFGGIFSTGEELIPFTDIIPSLTLVWFVKYVVLGGEK